MKTEFLNTFVEMLRAHGTDTFLWKFKRRLLTAGSGELVLRAKIIAKTGVSQDSEAREIVRYIEYKTGKRGVESL